MPINPRLMAPLRFRASFDPRNLPGLVAYWPMSEDASLTNAQALDVSGNGFHLTSSGALTNPGRNGSGRLLAAGGGQWNPSPARLSRGLWNTTPQWDANATGWSVAFWLFTDLTNNTQGTSSTAAGINFSTIASGGAESVRLGSGTPANGFAAISSRCYFTDNSFLAYQTGINLPVGGMTSITPQGQWTHMAFVADPATRTYTMYVNGVARTPLTYAADKVLSSFSSGLPCLMQWPGTIDEAVVYNRAISASEVLRLAGVALSASSPSTLHPECRSWISRVLSNGGTVSTTTASAVNDFCAAIDAAGIRDRFYRLSLFAGSNLSAALVPLYRGQSLGGTQFGNTTDTNINFAAGDYVETNGLTGNGSSKYLQTGLQPSAWITGGNVRSHLAIYKRTGAVVGSSGVMLGSRLSSTTPARQWEFGAGGHPLGENHATQPLPTPYDSFLCATRETDASVIGSRNSTFNSAVTHSTTVNATSVPIAIFCRNNRSTDSNGYTPSIYSDQTLAAYSIGGGLTQAEVLAYNTAMQAFQTALGRNV